MCDYVTAGRFPSAAPNRGAHCLTVMPLGVYGVDASAVSVRFPRVTANSSAEAGPFYK